ncbi:hypothetical protein KUV33_19370 [Leisingera daeponensis]|nr:hypothetical protein [Leisingera daeponensis]
MITAVWRIATPVEQEPPTPSAEGSSPPQALSSRVKAKGHSASPRTALDLLARIQKHTAHAGNRTLQGISRTTPEQLDLFEAMDLPKPA